MTWSRSQQGFGQRTGLPANEKLHHLVRLILDCCDSFQSNYATSSDARGVVRFERVGSGSICRTFFRRTFRLGRPSGLMPGRPPVVISLQNCRRSDDCSGEPNLARRSCSARTSPLVIYGTAAGERSAKFGAYYAGPGNKFWRVLYEVGLTPDRALRPSEFRELLSYGIGLS